MSKRSTSTKEKAEQLLKLAAPLEAAELRARELHSVVPDASCFIGVCGTNVDFDSIDIVNEFITLRQVTNSPGVVHIARASNLERTDYLGVARY